MKIYAVGENGSKRLNVQDLTAKTLNLNTFVFIIRFSTETVRQKR